MRCSNISNARAFSLFRTSCMEACLLGDSGDVYAMVDRDIRADLLDGELEALRSFSSDRRQLV